MGRVGRARIGEVDPALAQEREVWAIDEHLDQILDRSVDLLQRGEAVDGQDDRGAISRRLQQAGRLCRYQPIDARRRGQDVARGDPPTGTLIARVVVDVHLQAGCAAAKDAQKRKPGELCGDGALRRVSRVQRC